jgi:hypothetical protein
MPDVPSRSRSGVRLEGDDYQHLVTLNEVLRAIRGNGIGAVTVEAVDAGNVDDVVLHGQTARTRFTQVKHAVDGQTPVGTEWLLAPTRKRGKSLLQRFHASWTKLGGAGRRPHLQLVTDRDIDPNDAIMRMIDRRSSLVVPAIRASSVSHERAEWSEHLGVSNEELFALLEDLRFVTGRSLAGEREIAELQLQALGLVNDQGAIDSGLALIREWVQERERTIDVDTLRGMIEERIGRSAEPGALVVVEGIDDDPAVSQADVSIRFVELYDGDEPFSRRQMRSHGEWQTKVWPEMQSASRQLRDTGRSRVVVGGQMRLPMWFGAGCALREVLGFNVSTLQRGQTWSSDDLGEPLELEVGMRQVGDHAGLAVVVSIAADATKDVMSSLGEVPVGRMLTVAPAAGASPASVPDGPTAAALAVAIRNVVREHLDGATDLIHLFLAAPGGLAFLLGHRWNALRPTIVYEHLGVGVGYIPTFRLPA